jgi:hypothetical protein
MFLDDGFSEQEAEPMTAQAFLLLSASVPSIHPCTLQFTRLIQGRLIRVLVDSGSTHSFLDVHPAASLSGVQPLPTPTRVAVANGGSVACEAQIQYAEWSIQGYNFHSTLKLIPIGSYDMIIGMD